MEAKKYSDLEIDINLKDKGSEIVVKSVSEQFRPWHEKDWFIFTKNGCGHCINAKKLLQSQNIPFRQHEINDENREHIFREIDQHTGRHRTYPIIFYMDEFFGGFDDLEIIFKKVNLL